MKLIAFMRCMNMGAKLNKKFIKRVKMRSLSVVIKKKNNDLMSSAMGKELGLLSLSPVS